MHKYVTERSAISYHASQCQVNVMLVQTLCNNANNEHQTEHQSEIDDPLGPSVKDQFKDHPVTGELVVT